MSILLNGDCLELMKDIDDTSVDLIFCDLPYVDEKGKGQTSCSWNQSAIDLDKFWIEVMRIKKLNTPIFFTTTTKFGVSLINSAPKKCFFRYDIVWVKSAPAGFLSAKKMPMRKHEMIYVFYEKLPFYDLSSHTHKFLKEEPKQIIKGDHNTYNTEGRKKPIVREKGGKYETPLPVSVVKEETGGSAGEELDKKYKNKGGLYSKVSRNGLLKAEPHYDPPLPVSVVKEETGGSAGTDVYDATERFKNGKLKKHARHLQKGDDPIYDPPLPVSVVKEETGGATGKEVMDSELYGELPTTDSYAKSIGMNKADKHKVHYDPPLPNTMLEIKSTRGKHSTEKPVALMEWVLKYYSREGDTILDPTMGSGSTGVACKNMNRNFIGIEKDPEIYEVAVNRIEG